MIATCYKFTKSGRGRPGLDLPCEHCGVAWKNHGKEISVKRHPGIQEAQDEGEPEFVQEPIEIKRNSRFSNENERRSFILKFIDKNHGADCPDLDD